MKPLALMRMASTDNIVGNINLKEEAKKAKEKLTASPETVSVDSSVRHVTSEMSKENHDDADMMAGIYSDMKTIRETFSLAEVPKEAYWIGMAGVVPYMATSLSTVYAAWEINQAATTGSGLFLNEKSAELMLHIIEPIQVAYGAAIISFTSAIHWGLEFAGFGGHQGYKRYQIGVFATAAASATVLMPIESALISQFLIFNFMYYTDSRAAKKGLAPSWYGVYRFVLTFIVGSAIVASLIGRGQIAGHFEGMPGPADKVREFRKAQTEVVEEGPDARINFLGEPSEDDEEEEEEEEDDE